MAKFPHNLKSRHLIWPNSVGRMPWPHGWLQIKRRDCCKISVCRGLFYRRPNVNNTCNNKTCEDFVKTTCTLADQNVVAADGYSARRLGDTNYAWLRCLTRMAQEGCLSRSWRKWCPCQAEMSSSSVWIYGCQVCTTITMQSRRYRSTQLQTLAFVQYPGILFSLILWSVRKQLHWIGAWGDHCLGKVWQPDYFFNRLHMMCLLS